MYIIYIIKLLLFPNSVIHFKFPNFEISTITFETFKSELKFLILVVNSLTFSEPLQPLSREFQFELNVANVCNSARNGRSL